MDNKEVSDNFFYLNCFVIVVTVFFRDLAHQYTMKLT